MSGDLSRGQAEATEFIARIVERADATGLLRAVIDAVKSNRVVDDVSHQWSRDRIDFERNQTGPVGVVDEPVWRACTTLLPNSAMRRG